jgi:hypothetical protein
MLTIDSIMIRRALPLIAVGALLISYSASAQPHTGEWSALAESGAGFDGPVYAVTYDDDGHVYAGGHFRNVGSVAANGIARWDGQQWHAVGEGVWYHNGVANGSVRALAYSNGMLYAGGFFRFIGGVETWSIGMWDGTEWHALDGGLGAIWSVNLIVRDIVADGNGGVFVGGNFHKVGDQEAFNIAHWDGQTWSPLGAGLRGVSEAGEVLDQVFAIAVDGSGRLFAGGLFTEAGGLAANHVAMWDGVEWSPLEGGLSGGDGVFALAHDGHSLFAGGSFSHAASVETRNIAHWDGTSWHPMGEGLCDPTFALMVAGGVLYSDSHFDCSLPSGESRFGAQWVNDEWHAWDSGSDGRIEDMAVRDSDVAVAGQESFLVGSEAASGVAIWRITGRVGSESGPKPEPVGARFQAVYPNPLSELVTIEVLSGHGQPVVLAATNPLGQQVFSVETFVHRGVTRFAWRPRSRLPPGPYVLSLTSRSNASVQSDSRLVVRQ